MDGLGIAAAPWCIVGVIAMLGTRRPLANACTFLAGAVTTMVALYLICWALFGDLDLTVHTTPASTTAKIETAAGLVLLAWAGVRYLRRPKTPRQGPPPTPRWLSAVDRIRPLIAYPLGLCMPNPILAVAGSLVILKAGLSTAESAAALAFFIVVSLCTLTAPVLVYARSPEQVSRRLAEWKVWLAANSRTILTVLLAFYGGLLVFEGLKDLL